MKIQLSDHFTYGRLLKFTFPSFLGLCFFLRAPEPKLHNIIEKSFDLLSFLSRLWYNKRKAFHQAQYARRQKRWL